MTKKTQATRFVERARELGCDKSEASFDGTLKTLARTKPKRASKKKRKRKLASAK